LVFQVVLVLLLVEPRNIGSWLSASGILLGARSISRSALMAVTGVGASKPLLIMREPVTVTCSTASPALCAQAEADAARQKDDDISKVLRTRFMDEAPGR
jgi:hypothetical protein